ncbi:hypothetical protein HanRHA438_Chr11g0490871 [Helianthus annuus]|nr:hypothetical protein HanHA300_Chr11g0391491 [Helianthus annuus]KAJ0508207.1 hypothetical protein HanIR_Chr11g0514691 [Helianthus annuus]KAJ0516505.1 hypothetical protein HanHA89_Chr11g0414581 [Helianthus annuus]KAJ0688446.1 hypothetical protein HanOQP8_Chr11g0394391 [Helianthus annuus]KAJ0869598.1 hypothetical protein HanRHA438_Chr11g0490871 [Helianthus annuus]
MSMSMVSVGKTNKDMVILVKIFTNISTIPSNLPKRVRVEPSRMLKLARVLLSLRTRSLKVRTSLKPHVLTFTS